MSLKDNLDYIHERQCQKHKAFECRLCSWQTLKGDISLQIDYAISDLRSGRTQGIKDAALVPDVLSRLEAVQLMLKLSETPADCQKERRVCKALDGSMRPCDEMDAHVEKHQ